MSELYPKGPVTGLGNGYVPDEGPEPNDRSVYMYMEPPKGWPEWRKKKFAQCIWCRMRVPKEQMAGLSGDFKKDCDLCVILGSNEDISPDLGTCGEYAIWASEDGAPDAETVAVHAKELAAGIDSKTTKETVGYVEREVRCENCYFGRLPTCDWFYKLTLMLPRLFFDNARIDEYGCCNTQTAKDD